MTKRLIASGNGTVNFINALTSTSGSDLTIVELDLQDKVVLPFAPDIPVGKLLRLAMPSMDAALRVIPGVHLHRSSTYTVTGNVGTLRIFLTTNPLFLLPISVPTLIIAVLVGLSFLGVAVVVGWRIFKEDDLLDAGVPKIALIVVGGLVVFGLLNTVVKRKL